MATVTVKEEASFKLEVELNKKEAEQLKAFMQNAQNDYEEPELRALRHNIWSGLNDLGVGQ